MTTESQNTLSKDATDAPADFPPRVERLVFVALIAVLIIAMDHATKYGAIVLLKHQPPIDFLGGLFRLVYAENTGAFLSLGSGLSEGARFWALTFLNAVILSVVLLILVIRRMMYLPAAIALGLIFAGGAGNLIDRIFRDGRVVDFMNVGITTESFNLRTGIFNIADLAIMGGLFLLIAIELLQPASRKEEAAKEGERAPQQ